MAYSTFLAADLSVSALLAWAAAFRGGRHGFSVTGGVLLGMLCGLASPVLRGMFIAPVSIAPLWLFAEPAYPAACFLGACAALAVQRRGPDKAAFFCVPEAFSLGLATGLGVCAALAAGLSPLHSIVAGFSVGAVGGFARDICLAERPALFEVEFYGSALLVGAMAATALHALGAGFWSQTAVSAGIVVALRLWGSRRGRLRGVVSEF